MGGWGCYVPIRRKDQPEEPLQQLLLGHVEVSHAVIREEPRPRRSLGQAVERAHVAQPVLVHGGGRGADVVHGDAPVERVGGLADAVVEQVVVLDEVEAALDGDGVVVGAAEGGDGRGADADDERAEGAVGGGLAGLEAVHEASAVQDGREGVHLFEPVVQDAVDEGLGREEGEVVGGGGGAVSRSRPRCGARGADEGAQVGDGRG